MQTSLKSLSSGLLKATLFSTVLIAPLASQAQSGTFYGSGAAANNAPYSWNLAFGYNALLNANASNIAAGNRENTAIGFQALQSDTVGWQNTAVGWQALLANTTGIQNNAIGTIALFSNTTGNYNNAVGFAALYSNTTGIQNDALGTNALYSNTTGSQNNAFGHNALYSNTTGIDNTAIGHGTLRQNTTGNYNIALGYQALLSNTTGYGNVAEGYQTLFYNTTGYGNIANGYQALVSDTAGLNNTALGSAAGYYITTGNFNIALGSGAGSYLTTGNYNIAIGNAGTSSDNGVIRIGTSKAANPVYYQTATYIAGINGVNIGSGVPVVINSNGQLGTITSSRRFKKDIHSMGSVTDKLMQLRPVTFRYKQAAENGTYPLQYGLIAEEVAKVYPDLVQYDKQGKPFTIYYHLLTPMLLNALQKEHHAVVALNTAHQADRAEIAALNTKFAAMAVAHNEDKAEIAALKQSLAKLAAYIEANQNHAPVQKAMFIQH